MRSTLALVAIPRTLTRRLSAQLFYLRARTVRLIEQ